MMYITHVINSSLKYYILIMFLNLSVFSFSQKNTSYVNIHSRVDTTNREINEVTNLFINYLQSQPDSIYNNPFWNNQEKIKYPSFDFSIPYLYQFPSKHLLRYYQPTILSIEKEGDNYCIRTIFSADGLQGEYRKSNPWCITKLYAVKENNEWKLRNTISVITEKWKKKIIGKITFIYPTEHVFNKELAIKADQFCNDIAIKFQFTDWQPFDFYITKSGDELGKLLNFDFYFAGYTTGVSIIENRILLTGLDSEFYPHEFLHLILPKYNRHWMIEEGFATWQGGANGKTFNELAIHLANEVCKNDTVTFKDVLNKKWGHQHTAFYISGAVFCNLIYDKGGLPLIKKLLETSNNDEILIEKICNLLKIKKEDLNSFWRSEILKFKNK